MHKLWKRVLICCLFAGTFWIGSVIADRQLLREELIRLHVVANSDSQEDQAVKLRVRDAILESLKQDLERVGSVEEAKRYLEINLPKIEAVANQVLRQEGLDLTATATLCKETFDIREYDTFTLPSGVYESLRIKIGEATGRNWWCVVFPAFCMSAASENFSDIAVGAGFSEALTDSLAADGNIQIRFYFLDLLGRMENILYDGGI